MNNDQASGSVHATALKARVARLLDEDPKEWWPLLRDVQARMQSDFYPRWIVDFAVQLWRGGYGLEDAYGFSQIWTAFCVGELGFVFFNMGLGPAPDADLERNRAAFATLHENLSAVITCERGRGASDDGVLTWSKPMGVPIYRSTLQEGDEFEVSYRPPGSAPIEIGTTSISASLFHLARSGALARWPYGSKSLILGVDLGGSFKVRL